MRNQAQFGVFKLGPPNPITGLRPIDLIGGTMDVAASIAADCKVRPKARYMEERHLKSGIRFYWGPPHWSKKLGCEIPDEPLGSNYEYAMRRSEVLNRLWDDWRRQRKHPQVRGKEQETGLIEDGMSRPDEVVTPAIVASEPKRDVLVIDATVWTPFNLRMAA